MSFDQNSKFDPSKNYGVVKFGARKPVLETELNELQEIQNHARAEIVRKSIHSGVLNLGAITTLPTTPNTIRVAKQEVNVNGYLIDIPQTDITLPEPPTEGERDDFVFLEAWFEVVDSIKDPAIKDSRIGEETSRRIKLNWRIRTVAGVDFSEFPEGFTKDASSINTWVYNNQQVVPQGGNTAPLDTTIATVYNRFYNVKQRNNTTGAHRPNIALDDVGLYVAGIGDQTSKDFLKTVDGFVYAIPLFRVKRRNSGGYSQNNGNGARNVYRLQVTEVTEVDGVPVTSTNIQVYRGQTLKLKFNTPVTDVRVGDIMARDIIVYRAIVVTRIIDDYTIEGIVEHNGFAINNGINSWFYLDTVESAPSNQDRPDGKFANIIHQDDIVDLRHQVSLTGWNYDKLLEENFDKLLRGELRTKEGQKMLKTYHGIRKTPIDSNTVFYASLDGTTVAEVGSMSTIPSNPVYKPTVTGLGLDMPDNSMILVPYTHNGATTIDTWFRAVDISKLGSPAYLVQLSGANTSFVAIRVIDKKYLYMDCYKDGQRQGSVQLIPIEQGKWYHVRLIVDGRKATSYINGVNIGELTIPDITFTNVYWGYGSTSRNVQGIYSDLSISNVNRGATFATLPKDFIDGYATIMPAFNGQRRNFSDAQISQHTISIAKPKALVSDRGITVEKGTGTNETIWETGDKIKVKGLAGEIIGDVPAPKVKASLDGGETTIDVVGTWTGLGTSEATFTLGANTNLDTEDVFIEYSLNSPSGQGGIPEVLTEVLEGEYLGQKYVKGAPKLKIDFRGKVAGSILENPHFFKTGSSTNLLSPNSTSFIERGAEFANGENIHLRDNKVIGALTNENGEIGQQLFSFNLIAEVERQLGRIPKASKAEKVQWLKDNVSQILGSWWGYGSSPSGNSAKFRVYNYGTTTGWASLGTVTHTHTSANVTRAQATLAVIDVIDNNGFVHFLAYAEPSDGVTPSVIYTDYVELEIEFKTPKGYDTLTPAEPFHNGTRKNFFFIRKETKEIEMMFNCDEDYGVITWGNYVPYQGTGIIPAYKQLGKRNAFITTGGTGGTYAPASYNNVEQRLTPIAHLPLHDVNEHEFIPANIKIDGEIRDATVILGESGILRSFYLGLNTSLRYSFGIQNLTDANVRGKSGSGSGYQVFTVKTPDKDSYLGKYLLGDFHLALIDSSLYLVVGTLDGSKGNNFVRPHAFDTFLLEGRPLVKGVN